MANLQVGVAGNGTVTVGAGASVHSPASNTLTLGTNNSERLRIDSAGLMGLGTASPSHELQVEKAGNTVISAKCTASGSGANAALRLESADSSSDWYIQTGNAASGGLRFYSGADRLRIDSSGRLLVGSTATNGIWGVNASLQVEGTSGDTSAISIIRNSNNSSSPYLTFGKSRGGSNGSATAVQDDDGLGAITWTAGDGTDMNSSSAQIIAVVDGTPGGNDTPGRLVFKTTSDGASGGTERVRVSKHGQLVLSNGSMSVAYGNSLCGGTNLELDTTGIIKFRTDTNQKMSVTDNGLCFGTDSASANALDDYEEGSFTPGLSNGGTLTVYSCKYTKIGREVTIHAYFYVQDIPDNGNNFLITGLPYAITSDTSAIAGGCWSYGGNLTDAYKMAPSGSPGGSVAHFYWLDGANSGGILQNNSFDGTGPNNTRYIGFKLFYYT